MLNKYKKIQDKILPSLSAFALINTAAYTGIVFGQSQATVEEIVVTARKKSESLQDVPVSVSALSEQSLEEKGVNVFEDYLLQMPGVTAGGVGPGNNTIYIRGLASTTPAMTTAGVAGLAPNVSFYLDEQPLAQPGRNLDVYAADVSRLEVLSGPQGTLFGASSQAGVVRMITNKPVIGESSQSLEVEGRFMTGGDTGNKFEYVSNIPLTSSSALRFVAYRDKRGGYIDQVAGTRNVTESARFRTADTVRANGLVVGTDRDGFQAGADLSAATFLDANAIVKDNSNPITYEGFRASIATEINDNWDALVSFATQDLESEGVFFVDPELGGDYEIQRYSDDYNNDSFDNMSLTLEGSIGDLEVIYAGAYTDRATDQNIDYTDYLFVGQYVPYYICDGVTNYTAVADAGTCQAPDMYVAHTGSTEVTTHEFRINTDINEKTSITAGVFYSDLEMIEHNEFTYPGSAKIAAGYAPNYPHTNPQPGQGGNAGAGWYSQPGPYNAPIIFVNDILRTDEQKGVFGEANIALSDTMELTLGARWYDIAVDLEGSANGAYGNKGATSDSGGGGANLSVQYGPNNANGYPDKAETDGIIGKATLSWKPSDDLMYYLTWSEGFRPGLLNRPAGTSNASGTYTIPAVTDTDEVTNYEFGWKASLMNGALRFNGSAFMVDISGLQSTIFDAAIVNLFFSDNAADAEIRGIEGDFVYITENSWMISGAFSILDSEITKSLVPTSDIVVGSELAFAPAHQANIAARKEWGLSSGNTAHWQGQLTFSDDSYSDIMEPNRAVQKDYNLLNIRAGVSNDDWMAEIYIDNLSNERAEIANTFIFDRERISVVRPRTLGLRYKRSF